MIKQSLASICLALLLVGYAAQAQEPQLSQPMQHATLAADRAYIYIPGDENWSGNETVARERWLAATDAQAMDVLKFWFEEWDQDEGAGGKGRYNDKWFPHGPLGAEGSKEIDREIRERYLNLFQEAVAGRLGWNIEENPYENLAFILLIDQFSRNMFRGTPQSYEHDPLALEAARLNVEKGFHRYYFTGYQRLFVVYPLLHHESLASQEMCLYLLKAINEQEDYPYQFLNAMQKGVEHLQMIFMFGRFPHRNERLGRASTAREQSYLALQGSAGFVDGSKW
jgi:uncharacterized protein (DUF924 family)